MSVINEPEPAGGQSSAVGVAAPIGTAKWLSSDKFIVLPPAGAWDKQGEGGGSAMPALVGTGSGWSGPKRIRQTVSPTVSVSCVLTPVLLDGQTEGLTTLNTFPSIQIPKVSVGTIGKKEKKNILLKTGS